MKNENDIDLIPTKPSDLIDYEAELKSLLNDCQTRAAGAQKLLHDIRSKKKYSMAEVAWAQATLKAWDEISMLVEQTTAPDIDQHHPGRYVHGPITTAMQQQIDECQSVNTTQLIYCIAMIDGQQVKLIARDPAALQGYLTEAGAPDAKIDFIDSTYGTVAVLPEDYKY